MIGGFARGLRPVLVALLLAACAQLQLAAAETPKTVFLEELTWTELRDQVRAGKTTIIMPIGGTEQSGPHMALGKHNVRASALAGQDRPRPRQCAGRAGDRLRARRRDRPADRRTCASPARSPSPAAAFETTLEYAARSLRRHGFRDIVLLGDHGGYQQSLQAVWPRSSTANGRATPVRVHALTEYYRAAEHRLRPGAASARLQRRRDRQPCRPCRHRCRSRSRRSDWCAPTGCAGGAKASRPTACAAIRAARAPSSASSAST